MDWIQAIVIIVSILIPTLTGLLFVIKKLMDLEKRMTAVEDRLLAVEARLTFPAPHIYAISDRMFY